MKNDFRDATDLADLCPDGIAVARPLVKRPPGRSTGDMQASQPSDAEALAEVLRGLSYVIHVPITYIGPDRARNDSGPCQRLCWSGAGLSEPPVGIEPTT
ncbi:hypothetical protein ACFQ3F_00675 [Nocardioides ginsengisoli]|uniref:Transposase IS111A/IS1328/IS1533 N-terminal domain-containing protein n=1 Tax=Nocardioides ginsengisoli TaxID=363868 RepID=A0ABW3VUF3_9ACTN